MPRLEFAWCTCHIVGAQWVGKTPPRPSQTLQLAPRANDHEDGQIGADETFFPERTIVTRGPAGSCAISIKAVVIDEGLGRLVRDVTKSAWCQWCLGATSR